MAERREEKYLISYAEYAVIANRVRGVMAPDANGDRGRYSICSLYFDDAYDTAFDDKEDGNAVHIKFRVRTYDGNGKFIRLERKTKRGVITEKHSSVITGSELDAIISGKSVSENADCFGLVSEMRAKGVAPKINVRYDREAYHIPTLGVRVTFDFNIEYLPADKNALFGDLSRAVPAMGKDKVVMEIKYAERCPALVRKICGGFGMQTSVSKYALCRTAQRPM